MVTGYPSYPAYPAGPPLQLAQPAPVHVAVGESAQQHRATVAFRLILVIPHLFLLCFLGIAALVIAFLGWWGALFTGRLPEFAVAYLSGFIRWRLRVWAYLYLLTDVYPPFTLDDVPAYPVRLLVPEPQRLNRAAVFFRAILIIPAWIVAELVAYGAAVVLFVAWLITLIAGRMPVALHQALTAVLRYQTRLYGYLWMLTPAYPAGVFGDAPGAPPAVGNAGPSGGFGTSEPGYSPAPGYGAGPGYGVAPGYGAAPGYDGWPGYGTPGSVYGPPSGYGSYGAPGGYGPGHTEFQPASWQLVLTSGARRLVVLFLVLGVVVNVVNGVRNSALLSRAQSVNTANNAINTLNSSYSTLKNNLVKSEDALTACDQNLTCVVKVEGNASAYFSAFGNELRATPMPSSATAADANTVESDAALLARDYTKLGQATSISQYQSTLTSLGLQQLANQFDDDINALGTALNNS
jgi:hypothetical protein